MNIAEIWRQVQSVFFRESARLHEENVRLQGALHIKGLALKVPFAQKLA